jgi:pyruvate formate lyase activating enzyme
MRCQGTALCESRCLAACTKGALEPGEEREDPKTGEMLRLIHVKRDKCTNCGDCAKVCYPRALYLCGEDYTVEKLAARLLQDKKFFTRSGGGITVSGGEALSQPEFTVAILTRMQAEGVHTALDTTGFAPWEVLERTTPYTDLYLYDLKHMDSEKHRQTVGVPNERILENAKRLAAAGKKMQIRIPVIPLFNNAEGNIRATAAVCRELGEAVTVVQLLPYHNLGVAKYLRISDKPAIEATPPSEEQLQRLKGIMEEYGLPVTIH